MYYSNYIYTIILRVFLTLGVPVFTFQIYVKKHIQTNLSGYAKNMDLSMSYEYRFKESTFFEQGL